MIKAPKRFGNISLVKYVVELLGGSSEDAFKDPSSPEYQITQTKSRDGCLMISYCKWSFNSH